MVLGASLLADLEESPLVGAPTAAVAFVIPPELVWGREEALWGPPTITRAHVGRTRAQVRRLAGWLPVDGLPNASATLLRGCESITHDDVVRTVTLYLLDKYALLLQRSASDVSLRN